MPKPYKNPTCRGAYSLGTACGHCERCADDPMNPENIKYTPPSEAEKIWVIGIDYGTEGKQAPDMAFRDKETAEGAKALCERNGHSTVYLAEVPVWKH